MPCCAACEHNVKWNSTDRNPVPAFILFIFLGIIIVGIISNFIPMNENVGMVAGVVLGIVMGILWMRRQRRKYGPVIVNESHVCHLWKPVFIRRFDRNTITFAFLRDAYAQRFAPANGAHEVQQSVLSRELVANDLVG